MPSKNSNDDASLCAFTFSDGRHCRMLRSSSRSEFCLHHERKLRHLRETDYTAAEICDPISHDFVPASVLTHSLTRVFRAVAEGRIDPKSATALARVASTLLKSIGESSREFNQCFKDDYWSQLILNQYNDMPVYVPDGDDEDEDKDEDEEDDGSEVSNQGSAN